MNKENISEIISGIDEKFIEESANIKKKPSAIKKYVGIAACFIVAAVAGVFVFYEAPDTPPTLNPENTTALSGEGERFTESGEIVTEPAIETVTGTEMMIMPTWDDRTISEKFMEITLGDITYTSKVQKISEDNILSFISEVQMTGYDIYEDKTYTETGKIYSIKHISEKCAVAVRIGSDESFYVFTNAWYSPDTLGDFINDLDLKNTVRFGKGFADIYEYADTYSSHKRIIYADFDDSLIWDMLLDDTSVKNTEYNYPYDRIGVETDLPLLGYKNINFSVTPDGYIITNILDTQKVFYVGSEKTNAFIKYLENNIPSKEEVTVYEKNPDGTIPGKSEEVTGEITPGYDPGGVNTAPPYNPEDSVTSPAFIPEWEKTGNTAEKTTVIYDAVVEAETVK